MIIESPLFGVLLGLCVGIVIGYLWRNKQEQSARTIRYPEPQYGEERPPGACVEQPEVKPIVVDTKDKYGSKTGFYIENWQEVIMNLTPEQNARTRRNVP